MLAPCEPEAVIVEAVRFPAGPFSLEGELVYPEQGMPTGVVVIAGPHPLLGGTMHNNVVRSLGDGLGRKGFACLRFNYRGVGRSTGPAVDVAQRLAMFWHTSHAPEEEEHGQDLQGAVSFALSDIGEDLPLALVGYSFGCTLLPEAVQHAEAMVLIAPTAGTHNLDAFASLPQPKLIVAPEHDFAVRENSLADWFSRMGGPWEVVRPTLDGHFFRGHEDWLTSTVAGFLGRLWRYLP
jgi:alpha/beta superfamily hydrolase